MNYRILFLTFFCVLSATAQEVVTDLVSSPRVVTKAKYSSKLTAVTLPFFDDFSNHDVVLDVSLWEESGAFVNRNYGVAPVTTGVLTFDGLNKVGLAYDLNFTNPSGNADTLTSRIIDLSVVDTAYFMFYFQPQGLGDNPQIIDSLILEFKDAKSNWHTVWKKEGDYSYEFTKKVILINSSDYLVTDFQFRFRNLATLSGNFDHWNIDYVKLDVLANNNDTLKLNDVSFIEGIPSFLKRYNEMPWSHFKNNKATELNDTVAVYLRNNKASINVDYQYNVFENGLKVAHYPSLGASRNVTVYNYDSIGVFSFEKPSVTVSKSVFDSNTPDSVSFTIQQIIGTANNDNKLNDTLYRTQNFYSHFSYDDGSAELAYGMNAIGARGAYQFKLNRPDTLRAIQIYFPQMLDSVNHIPFMLTVWDDKNGVPGSVIYSSTVYPKHTEDGKFHYYYLDSLFQMAGVFYVGWEQLSPDLLNVGLDKNRLSNQYMFYNVGAGWVNSQFLGSWMIRPVLSLEDVVLNSVISSPLNSFEVYPNPSSDILYLKSNSKITTISIYNLQGKLVHEKIVNDKLAVLDVSFLPSALYILKASNDLGVNYKRMIIE